MRRTKEQAAETGRQILNAAETLFLEKGFDNVSLEEIAAAAGLTRGAIHWHFRNKHGLLFALRDRAKVSFKQLADELAESNGGASLEKLGDLLAELLERLHNDPRQQGLLRAMIRFDLSLAEKGEPAENSFREEMQAAFLQIFRVADTVSPMPQPWTPETAASLLRATVEGLVLEWALKKSTITLVPDAQCFVRMVLSNWQR